MRRPGSLDRLAVLSGLIARVREGAAGGARSRVAALQDELAGPALITPPADADPDTAAQHARWAAARRAILLADLAAARADLAARNAAARRAFGVDGAVNRLLERQAFETRRKARRDQA